MGAGPSVRSSASLMSAGVNHVTFALCRCTLVVLQRQPRLNYQTLSTLAVYKTTPKTEQLDKSHIMSEARADSFPAPSRTATGIVASTPTDLTLITFSDKMILTICQEGRLAQWVQVSLRDASPSNVDPASSSTGDQDELLPSCHLTPKTLLGARGDAGETLAHLCAAHVASQLAMRSGGAGAKEERTLMVGLGLRDRGKELGREGWFDLVELLQKVL